MVPHLEGGQPRRWPHRLLITSIALVAVVAVGTGAVYFYVRHQLGKIDRIDVAGLDDAGSDQPMNVLLVGSDSRDRISDEMADTFGRGKVSGKRSDTIMVLHVNPGDAKAAIVSIPRDLYLPIAGTKTSDRVNSAFSRDGADGLVATIEDGLDISINHYVEIDFVGFKDIVDAVGGVDYNAPNPVRDLVSGLSIENAGCARLDGDQGLALVRSRNFETLVGNKWQIDPTADLGRIERQQDFIRRILGKVSSSGLKNPARLNRLVNVATRDITLDTGMSAKDILKLARRFRSLDAERVDITTLPTRGASVGGASVLMLQKQEAKPMLDRLRGLGAPAPSTTAVAKGTTATTAAAKSKSTPSTSASPKTPAAAAASADSLDTAPAAC